MKPFLHGKKNLSIEPLRAPAALLAHGNSVSPLPGASVPAGNRLHGPTVEVVKEGDKIVRLVVTCVCGERTEVECLYPPGS